MVLPQAILIFAQTILIMNIIGIIPARYASTRFPGKPLAVINGKTMIMRVYEQALKAPSLSNVVVATDNQAIFNHVQLQGGKVVMTREDHRTGTERCFEVASKALGFEDDDVVINIQGDEPYIDPSQIETVAVLMKKKEVELATLVKKIATQEELFNPNVVKAVIGQNEKVLYFSRQALPFLRGVEPDRWLDNHDFYKHIGIYGYRVRTLHQLVALPMGQLEEAESLEQLRWLENGFHIHFATTTFESIAVDVPQDLVKLMNNC